MEIVHVLDKFLPLSEAFIYEQIRGLPQLDVGSQIVCHKRLNESVYQHNSVYPFHTLSSPEKTFYRIVSRLHRWKGAVPYWLKVLRRIDISVMHAHFGWSGPVALHLRRALSKPL